MTTEMRVVKRDGTSEDVSFDKILRRIKNLGSNIKNINYSALTMKVIDQIHDQIETSRIDELTAEQCAAMSTIHYDYGTLAARIVLSNHQKNTNPSFAKTVELVQLSSPFTEFVAEHAANLDAMLDHDRDYLIDFFGFKTLERSYLFKDRKGKSVERIQHLWMRVAVAIHMPDLALIKETYDLMSQKYFIHATPTPSSMRAQTGSR